MSKSASVFLSVMILASTAGCSGSGLPTTYKVSGTVTQGGKAVEGAMITFIPNDGQKIAIGSTNEKGEYKLSTFGPSDGAQQGGYKVTVTKIDMPATGAKPPLPAGELAGGDITDSYAPPKAERTGGAKANKNLLPAKYASEATSGLIATVADNDKNKFDFDL